MRMAALQRVRRGRHSRRSQPRGGLPAAIALRCDSSRLGRNAVNLLEPIYPGLYATPTTPLPFLAGVVVRSFLLERDAGNVLIYNSPGIDVAAADLVRLG